MLDVPQTRNVGSDNREAANVVSALSADKARGWGSNADNREAANVVSALSADKAWGWGPTPLKKDDSYFAPLSCSNNVFPKYPDGIVPWRMNARWNVLAENLLPSCFAAASRSA
jgi:hypothetical protein